MITAPIAFTYDDLMLVPQHSEIKSRAEPDLTSSTGTTTLKIPVFSSPMNTVTELEMLAAMPTAGGAAVLHRYMSIERQVYMVSALEAPADASVWVSVGINDIVERVTALRNVGAHRFCVDVANGYNTNCINAVRTIKDICPDAIIMAGNVCNAGGALRLAEAGADLVRVGIGPGAVCSTRTVTGHGVPQLTAIHECSEALDGTDCGIVADGGIRSSGDIVKSLAMGADFVMLGSLLAGTSATPGELLTDAETKTPYKYYSGMASEAGRAKDGWFDRSKTSYVPEGESTRVFFKGDTNDVLERLMGGVRSGMSYSGARTISELRSRAQWRQVTSAGAFEGTPHGVMR